MATAHNIEYLQIDARNLCLSIETDTQDEATNIRLELGFSYLITLPGTLDHKNKRPCIRIEDPGATYTHVETSP
jgi:hypothetical protein